MCWEKQNIFRSTPHTWVRSSRKGEGLPEEGWGGLGTVAEMKRSLFMGELEGQVELGAFFSMFFFVSFQFCSSHSTRTSSRPMASPNPGSPQTLSSGK